MKDQPFVLFSKDIQSLTGMSKRYAQRMIIDVWLLKGLPKQRWITTLDFSSVSGMPEEMVQMKLDAQRGKRP